MSTIIIITPPVKPTLIPEPPPENVPSTPVPYDDALRAVQLAELDGSTVRIIET